MRLFTEVSMKKTVIVILLVLLVFISSCAPIPTQSINPPVSTTPAVTETQPGQMPTVTEATQELAVSFDTFKNLMLTATEMRKQVQLVDGKWTDVVRAAPKRLEHDAFRCAKPSVLGHQTIELR